MLDCFFWMLQPLIKQGLCHELLTRCTQQGPVVRSSLSLTVVIEQSKYLFNLIIAFMYSTTSLLSEIYV